MSKLTHLDDQGQAHMVNIADKSDSARLAIASGTITGDETTIAAIKAGNLPKGDVLAAARIAAIMAAKKTPDLIPLCHALSLSGVTIDFAFELTSITLTARVELVGKTGAEMEALTAVSVGLLTLYDMSKAIDKGLILSDIHLVEKKGGKSGHWRANR